MKTITTEQLVRMMMMILMVITVMEILIESTWELQWVELLHY